MTQLQSFLNKQNVILLISFLFFHVSRTEAQILEKTIENLKSVYNLSYTAELEDKDLFSDSVFSETIKVTASLADDKKYTFRAVGADLEEVFDGNKLVRFNLTDSTYRVSNDTENSIYDRNLVSNLITRSEDDSSNHLPIRQLEDSVIDDKSYYQLKITERDSIVNGKRTFEFVTVLIDKDTYLPFSYRSDSQGFIDGTDIFLDTFSEYHFTNYKINSQDNIPLYSVEIPPYFSVEKPKKPFPLLVKGTKAPEIELFDLEGNVFSLESQKGKVVLLNFTLNGCPHCVESVPMLNKLHTKYSSSDLMIVTINPFDNEQSIRKNNAKFNIKYPTYSNPVDGKPNVDRYRIDGYPTFYLIDKRGNILSGFKGYYAALDKKLVDLIDKLISNSE